MRLTLGFSPCPNDTFIFDALVNKKIDTGDLEFEVILEDVETLNQWSYEKKLDITKLSFPALFQNLDNYVLFNSGAALGKGTGPVLISRNNAPHSMFNIEHSIIALPGKNTTANLLFSFACPNAINKKFMRFDKIEDFVLKSSSEASPVGGGLEGALGVIIHENRFTYEKRGLKKILDLGSFWEKKMNVPVPLGGIAMRRSISTDLGIITEKLIRKSLEFAFSNYPVIPDFVKINAQEMNEDVMKKHIDLYVNNFSVHLGEEGKKAIYALYNLFKNQQHSQDNSHLSGSLFLS